VCDEDGPENLYADGRIREKECLVTIDTGAAVSVARPDIAAGVPERGPFKKCVLQTASREILLILK
jgi:hypothetical protein